MPVLNPIILFLCHGQEDYLFLLHNNTETEQHRRRRESILYVVKKQNRNIKSKFVILHRFLKPLNFVNLFSFSLEFRKFRIPLFCFFIYLDHKNFIYQKLLFQIQSRDNLILGSSKKKKRKRKQRKEYVQCSDQGKLCYFSRFNLIEERVSDDCS